MDILIDENDSDIKVSGAYKTHPMSSTQYVFTSLGKYLHRVIMSRVLDRELLREEKVDHIDGNGLNNTRSNLRLVTHSENLTNRKGWAKSSSKYKGVTWYKRGSKWQAKICPKGKTIHLGYFENEDEAAIAYNNAVPIYFNKVASLNKVGI